MWLNTFPAMSSKLFRLLLTTLACGLSAAQSQPQASAPQASAPQANNATAAKNPTDDVAPGGTYRVPVEEVNVVFTVTDKHGKFVKDLKQREFKILDDNRAPKEVKHFESETNLPLRVGLLIDASNSIRDRFLFEQQAATEFLMATIRPQTDKAFVLAFDEVPTVEQDFTNDLGRLARGVKGIRPGGTAMWDAVYYACRDKLMKERTDGPVRRAIILVSDGDDNQSRVLRQEAIDM